MNRPALWVRAFRRARRERENYFHTRADRARVAGVGSLLSPAERATLLARLQGTPEGGRTGLLLPARFSERLAAWVELHPKWADAITREAAGPLRDEIVAFGRAYRIDDPRSWSRDPLRPRPWPLRPHARILLNDPRTPGDVRMQWEPARFHHAPALARYGLVTGNRAAPDAFLRQIDSFERGNPPFESIHWAVGMEVGIRAASLLLALDCFGGILATTEMDAERLLRLLLLHGVFLVDHPDRHPSGCTTNHTVATAAGLAVVGRWLDASAIGREWRAKAGSRLAECFQTQVLTGGAHAEGALPYERFVLEAGLVGFLCLDAVEREPLREPLGKLARHLAETRLGDGLPFIGDGDDSYFPPFGLAPLDERDPLDPEPVLQAAEALLGLRGLRRCADTREAAFWLGAEARVDVVGASDAATSGVAASDAPTSDVENGEITASGLGRSAPPRTNAQGKGFVRVSAGPFEGMLIARGMEEGWLTTHEHNDLLSLILTVDGIPVLIDPGTHGYAVDRHLRHRLRSTSAHSTLQFEDQEQSPLSPRHLFHGPPAIRCGAVVAAGSGLRLNAWHEGFRDERSGAVLRHARTLRWTRNTLWVTDTLQDRARDGDPAIDRGARLALRSRPASTTEPGERVHSTVRFRFAPGLVPVLDEQSGGTASRRWLCRVSLPGGTLSILTLGPAHAVWRIVPGVVSRRYASQTQAAILEGTVEGPLPHRWRVALRFGSDGRSCTTD